MDLSAKASLRVAPSETAAAIAQGATQLEEGIRVATQLARDVRAGLLEVQDAVADYARRVATLIWVVGLAIALVLAWGALLHVALWELGRRWRAL